MERRSGGKRRWPFGYRALAWLVGSFTVIMLIVEITFVLNAPR